jgi:hypothetical protein
MSFHAGASCLPYQWRGETILTHDQQLHHLRVQKERFQFFQLGLRTRTHHIFTIKPGSDITMRPATLGSIDRVSSDGPALSMWLDALAEKRSAEFCSLVLIKRHPYLHRYDRRWNTVLQILWLGFNFPCFGLKERTLQSFKRTKYGRSWPLQGRGQGSSELTFP